MISEDLDVANAFNNFFSGATKVLNINYFEHFSWDCVYSESEDPVFRAVEKYSQHPSILKIKQHFPHVSTFSFQPTNIQVVYKEIKSHYLILQEDSGFF